MTEAEASLRFTGTVGQGSSVPQGVALIGSRVKERKKQQE